jgi:hypothetical protein
MFFLLIKAFQTAILQENQPYIKHFPTLSISSIQAQSSPTQPEKPKKTRQPAIPHTNNIYYYNDKWSAESGASTQAKVHDVYHAGNDEIFPVQLCFLLTKYNLSYILYDIIWQIPGKEHFYEPA